MGVWFRVDSFYEINKNNNYKLDFPVFEPMLYIKFKILCSSKVI